VNLEERFSNGGNGDGRNLRDSCGRFLAGNRAAVGHGCKFAKRIGELRGAVLRAIGPDGLRSVVAAMFAAAQKGDVAAAKLLLSYGLGEPQPCDLLGRLDVLERLAKELA
jgi:hypothetical protein